MSDLQCSFFCGISDPVSCTFEVHAKMQEVNDTEPTSQHETLTSLPQNTVHRSYTQMTTGTIQPNNDMEKENTSDSNIRNSWCNWIDVNGFPRVQALNRQTFLRNWTHGKLSSFGFFVLFFSCLFPSKKSDKLWYSTALVNWRCLGMIICRCS